MPTLPLKRSRPRVSDQRQGPPWVLLAIIALGALLLGLFVGWKTAAVAGPGAVAMVAALRRRTKKHKEASEALVASANETLSDVVAKMESAGTDAEGAGDEAAAKRNAGWDDEHGSRPRPRG